MPGAMSETINVRSSMSPQTLPGVITVLLADDHAIVRAAMRTLIESQPDMRVVGEASDARSAVEAARRSAPRIVVLDLSMPNSTGTNSAAAEIVRTCPGTKVVVLTMHEEVAHLRALLAAGASGYVLKRSASGDVLHALRAVSEGGTYLDPAMAGRVVESMTGSLRAAASAAATAATAVGGRAAHRVSEPPVPLSEREEDVLRRIAQGYSNKEVAAQLSLSVKTVETYKARSMEKLRLNSRVDIVRYARDEGWLDRL